MFIYSVQTFPILFMSVHLRKLFFFLTSIGIFMPKLILNSEILNVVGTFSNNEIV